MARPASAPAPPSGSASSPPPSASPTGSGARADGYEIRRAAIGRGIPCITTMSGASAAQRAIRSGRGAETSVISLQELHGRLALPAEAERTA